MASGALTRWWRIALGIDAAGVYEQLELLDESLFGPFPELVEAGQRFGALIRA